MSKRLALLIANDEYRDPGFSGLKAPKADLAGLSSALKNKSVGNFDEVRLLFNKGFSATAKEIARFFKEKKRGDLLLTYFSGHGVLDEYGDLYLAVKNTERELLSATSISAKFISGEMDKSFSWSQVLILDCCHSGAFARGTKGSTGARVNTESIFRGDGSGRVILTATDSTQLAWEGDKVLGGEVDKSLFTHYLVEGLQSGEADIDMNGKITVDELFEYASTRTSESTPKQTPGKWSFEQQGDIVIARSRFLATAKALPEDVTYALRSPLPSVRTGALEALKDMLPGPYRAAAIDALRLLQHDDSKRISELAEALLADTREDTPKRLHKGSIQAIATSTATTSKATDVTRSIDLSSPTTESIKSEPQISRSALIIGVFASLIIIGTLTTITTNTLTTAKHSPLLDQHIGENPKKNEKNTTPPSSTYESIPPLQPPDPMFSVQVFSTASEKKSRQLLHNVESQGFDAFIHRHSSGSKIYFRVLIGPYPTRDQAEAASVEILSNGNLSTWISAPLIKNTAAQQKK